MRYAVKITLMLVIHSNWLLPLEPGDQGRLILWAETSTGTLKKPRGRPRAPAHAFAASASALEKAIQSIVEVPTAAPTVLNILLPALKNLPLPSPSLVHNWDELSGATSPGVKRFKLEGLALKPTDALCLLNRLPAADNLPPHIVLGDDLVFWVTAARLALEILAEQRYLPAIEQVDINHFHARWQPIFDRPQDVVRLSKLVRAMPPAARTGLPAELTGVHTPPPAHYILESFLNTLVDSAVREWHGPNWRPQPGDDVAVCWLNALFSDDSVIQGPYFSLSTLARAHKTWVRQLRAAGDANFRTCLRLDVPETPDQPWSLDFLLQATDDPSLLVEADTVWKSRGKILTYLDHRFDNPQERLLSALGFAAHIFPPLERSLKERRPTAAQLNTQEAYAFLREAMPLLEQSGFGLLVPPWWNKRGAHLGARLKMKTSTNPPDVTSGLLSMQNLVNFNWEIMLGDQALSRDEFDALVHLKSPLAQIRGQWVALNPEEIEAAIRFWEKRQADHQTTVLDALVWGLSGESDTSAIDGLGVDDVEVTGWLGELLDRLKSGDTFDLIPQPEKLTGRLRPYQERGFSWIVFMRDWGLGACLADDMGLGKTIQAICLFLHTRRDNGHLPSALVICPTSVVGNWQREVNRFAPDLKVLIHHGGGRATGDEFLSQSAKHDIVLTSYGLARRDGDLLGRVQWSTLVLDEAQNIKNPAAKQTQVIRRIPAFFRLALTGTPVENRLSELWSIMHFLNPGYLGSQKSFRTHYSLPIERYKDNLATSQLRQLVSPFILRRLKTDDNIIQDLPEKMEMKVYCNLTPEQATLYQAVVEDSLRQMEEAEEGEHDMQRRGLVLSTLMKLKQICNHPALFLGDKSALPERSGKLARLTEMLEEVLSVDERALIFSQFSSMGEMLKVHLQEVFGREVLFLYGGTPRKQRERMIERFQSEKHAPSIFILSLKAGGVGLNLTAANHIFHFDRWWNPAVEQQATDRAFRIGQTRNVQVHKYISVGTLEENIDQLIESKKELADSVVSTSENWLTELSTDDLRQILTLRSESAD